VKIHLLAVLCALAGAPLAAQGDAPVAVDSAMAPGTLLPQAAGRVRGSFRSFYPALLRDAGVGGSVVASFRVERDGTLSPGSLRLESADHELFAAATRQLVARLRFHPYPKPLHVTIRAEWKPGGPDRRPFGDGTLRFLRIVEITP
jgi:TonB family protein